MSRLPDYEFANEPWPSYKGGATFIRRCPKCFRFVKQDDTITVNGLGELVRKPNATCSQHGRVEMPFMGFVGPD